MKQEVIKSAVDQFIELVMQGIKSLCEAGAIAAAEVDKDPDFIKKVCAKCPDLTDTFVDRMVLVGRKRLHHRLAIMENAGARRLRELPFEVQERHIDTIPVLVHSEANGWETINMGIHNLTPALAEQAIDRDHIRSDAEQRAFIEDRANKKAAPTPPINPPYRVVGSKLVVVTGCQFTRKQLAQILAEME